MATSLHFKTSAKNLAAAAERAGIVLDVYTLLNLTDQLVTSRLNFDEHAQERASTNYAEALVQSALGSGECMRFMRLHQKINAIKELRSITGCGLREAKDAVEDHRVITATGFEVSAY